MKIYVVIDDELAKEFRKIVIEKYGVKKGALSKAVEEAIRLWVKKMTQSK